MTGCIPLALGQALDGHERQRHVSVRDFQATSSTSQMGGRQRRAPRMVGVSGLCAAAPARLGERLHEGR